MKFPGLLAPVQMKQLPRADVYNHVLNKYWTENNKRRGMEGGREGKGGGSRNLFKLFSNSAASLPARPARILCVCVCV